jgi:hypothetical protein
MPVTSTRSPISCAAAVHDLRDPDLKVSAACPAKNEAG